MSMTLSSPGQAAIKRAPRRSAFTMIELMVVIAIVGLLAGLLLPAVQQARDAARRFVCRNNLMQIGLALRSYESAHDCLPPGSVDPNRPIKNEDKGYHMGWMVQILPHLDHPNVFHSFDFSAGVYDKKNARATGEVIEQFICPTTGIRPAYAACHHDAEAPIDVDNSGVMFLNSSVRREAISDGASNTLFVGEVGVMGGWGWPSGTPATLRNTGSRLNAIVFAPGGAAPIRPSGSANLLAVGGFGSGHGTGAHMAFGDGSVRFVNMGISTQILRKLGNRADGELLADRF